MPNPVDSARAWWCEATSISIGRTRNHFRGHKKERKYPTAEEMGAPLDRGGGGNGPNVMRSKFEACWFKGSPDELSDIPSSATAVLSSNPSVAYLSAILPS